MFFRDQGAESSGGSGSGGSGGGGGGGGRVDLFFFLQNSRGVALDRRWFMVDYLSVGASGGWGEPTAPSGGGGGGDGGGWWGQY